MTRLRQIALAGLAALTVGGTAAQPSQSKPERYKTA